MTTTSNASTVSNWRYFSNPEDGARSTKGWFKVIAPDENGDDNTFMDYSKLVKSADSTFATGDAEDENERWYYADGDGELYEGAIKKIKGKYYGFAPEGSGKAGAMLTGLCALTVNKDGEITYVWGRDMDSDDLDDCMDGVGDFSGFGADSNDTLYYFGGDEDTDGALKTGSVTISLDGDSYSFQFSKSGGAESRGRGLTGIDDSKYIYKYGLKMKADSDDKYKIVYATDDAASGTAVVEEIDSAYLRSNSLPADQKNKDGDTIKYFGTLGSDYYLVNTSGSIIKNKTAAKDGDEWYFYVDDKNIKMYTNNKTLTVSSGDPAISDGTNSLKDDWDDTTVKIGNGHDGAPDADMID